MYDRNDRVNGRWQGRIDTSTHRGEENGEGRRDGFSEEIPGSKKVRVGQMILSGIRRQNTMVQELRENGNQRTTGLVQQLCKEDEVGLWDSFVAKEKM